jgi:hypothetical protein
MKTESLQTSYPDNSFANLLYLISGICLSFFTQEIIFSIFGGIIFVLSLIPSKYSCKLILDSNTIKFSYKKIYENSKEHLIELNQIKSIEYEKGGCVWSIAIIGSLIELMGIRNRQFKSKPHRLKIKLKNNSEKEFIFKTTSLHLEQIIGKLRDIK